MKIGVLAVQGAVSEHADALRRAAKASGRKVDVVEVRSTADLEGADGLILPGGESTTISRLLRSTGLHEVLVERGGKDLAVFGTCAGMILLADEASHDVEDKDIVLLGLVPACVDRNAFGRQRESFEAVVDVVGVGPMPAVFIRAPAYETTEAKVLARIDGHIVAARHGKVLVAAFHPELTPDTRLHELFLEMAS